MTDKEKDKEFDRILREIRYAYLAKKKRLYEQAKRANKKNAEKEKDDNQR